MVDWLLRVVKGALIGLGAVLPGISGGALSVVLGIYRPVMAFLAHPIQTFRKSASFLLPVLVGWALGVLLLARLLGWVLSTYEIPSTWVFVGLMLGTIPSLWREAGQQGRPRSAIASLCIAAVLMGGLLYFFSRNETLHIVPNIGWWALSGVFWGLGLIVPGLSPSSFFLFFGLYDTMMTGIGTLDLSIVLPMAVGLLLTVALLARGMSALLKRAYPIIMHGILGVVFASTLAIVPLQMPPSVGTGIVYAVCFLAGLGAAIGMDVLSKRFPPPESETVEPKA